MNPPIYENNIDFDTASIEWRKNKKYCKHGNFVYICEYIHKKTNKQCRRTIFAQRPSYLAMHFGGIDFNYRLFHHPNKYVYCKRHLLQNI